MNFKVPSGGEKIKVNKDFSLSVPDNPIIPYIEGDGTGIDITPIHVEKGRKRVAERGLEKRIDPHGAREVFRRALL